MCRQVVEHCRRFHSRELVACRYVQAFAVFAATIHAAHGLLLLLGWALTWCIAPVAIAELRFSMLFAEAYARRAVRAFKLSSLANSQPSAAGSLL